MSAKKLKADLHVHTNYSPDGQISPGQLVKTCRKKGINCVAITDHNTIEGARKVKEIAPFKVIIGEEIKTREGEICGLFLQEEIPAGLSVEETISRIKQQGGLVYIPHPFSVIRWEAINQEKLKEILPLVDIIEVFNGRNFNFENRRALNMAFEKEICMAAGSDAHIPSELGNVYLIIADFTSAQDFLVKLRESEVILSPYLRRLGSFLLEVFLFLIWHKFFQLVRWFCAKCKGKKVQL